MKNPGDADFTLKTAVDGHKKAQKDRSGESLCLRKAFFPLCFLCFFVANCFFWVH